MLSRRWLVNGLLVLAIAALATFGYRLDPAFDAGPAPASATIDAKAVDRIEITIASEILTLQRQESGWALLEPLSWPADRGSVERLLRITDTGKARVLAVSDADLAGLGFDDPAAQLRFGDIRVSFGGINNIGERRYTLIDSALFLLPDVHLPFVLQGSSGFVDRRLVPPRFELAALSLPGMDLRRGSDGDWQAAGDGDDVDPQRLAGMAAGWQDLAASRIGVYEGSASPLGRIVAELDDGQELEFLLLSTAPEIIIVNPALGLQYHFRRDRYDRLISPRDDAAPG